MTEEKEASVPFFQNSAHGSEIVAHSHVCTGCSEEFQHSHRIANFVKGRHPNVCPDCDKKDYFPSVRIYYYGIIAVFGLILVVLGGIFLWKGGVLVEGTLDAFKAPLVDIGEVVAAAGEEWRDMVHLSTEGSRLAVNISKDVVRDLEEHIIPLATQASRAVGGFVDIGSTLVEGMADATVATAFQLRMALWSFECLFRTSSGCVQDYQEKFGYCQVSVIFDEETGTHTITHHNCHVTGNQTFSSREWVQRKHKMKYDRMIEAMKNNKSDGDILTKYRPDLSNTLLHGFKQKCNNTVEIDQLRCTYAFCLTPDGERSLYFTDYRKCMANHKMDFDNSEDEIGKEMRFQHFVEVMRGKMERYQLSTNDTSRYNG